jgi:hypothetical protein
MAAPISSNAAASAVPDFGFSRAFGRIPLAASAAEASSPEAGASALSTAEQRQIDELRTIDRRVRAHEMAHINSGDGVVRGGAAFTYSNGPDGRKYAVGGEVPIDTSPGRTPEQTLAKARAIERAALAPADPSPQDRRIAARAVVMAAEAQRNLNLKSEDAPFEPVSARLAAFYRSVDQAGADGDGARVGGRLSVAA